MCKMMQITAIVVPSSFQCLAYSFSGLCSCYILLFISCFNSYSLGLLCIVESKMSFKIVGLVLYTLHNWSLEENVDISIVVSVLPPIKPLSCFVSVHHPVFL